MIVVLLMVLLALAGRSFCQAANATSHLKKPLIYQIGNDVRINADGERPLLRALDALQQKYGWIVDYEEPQYSADARTHAPLLPSRRHANAGSFRREGFGVEFTVGPTPDSRPDEKSVLATLVNAYDDDNAVAQFELRNETDNENDKDKQDRRFDVIGITVRNRQDEMQKQQPLLDLPITLAKGSRSAEHMIALICQKVSEKSKIPITVGAIDTSIAGLREVAIGGVEVPARTLLLRTVAAMGNRLSWRLLYDSSSKSYELTISGLQQ
jgi:hypothetical protein